MISFVGHPKAQSEDLEGTTDGPLIEISLSIYDVRGAHDNMDESRRLSELPSAGSTRQTNGSVCSISTETAEYVPQALPRRHLFARCPVCRPSTLINL